MTHFRTLRFDVEVDEDLHPDVSALLNDYDCKYWLNYEIADITAKPHYQGWIATHVQSEYKPLRELLKKLYGKTKYSYGKRNHDSYLSYCANNPSKQITSRVYTNYTEEEFAALKIPVYEDKRKNGLSNPTLKELLSYLDEAGDVVIDGRVQYDTLNEYVIQFLVERGMLMSTSIVEKFFCTVAIHYELKSGKDLRVYKKLHENNKKLYSLFVL